MVKKTSTSTYKPGESIANIQKKYNLKNVIKLASNENPLGPSLKSIQAIQDSVKNISIYPDSNGFYLRKKPMHEITRRELEPIRITFRAKHPLTMWYEESRARKGVEVKLASHLSMMRSFSSRVRSYFTKRPHLFY